MTTRGKKERLRIRRAEAGDVAALTRLIIAAFVVERPFIEGDRIDEIGTREYMEKGIFLVAEDSKEMEGCVFCELRGDRGYLGLLAVYPEQQGTGLGRDLMIAAEKYFRDAGCGAIDLRCISERTGLSEFYRKCGYTETGTTEPHTSIPVKIPFHFINMTKTLR